MQAGKLRHRVEIQLQLTEQDVYGERTGEWIEWKKVWAQVSPISGRERLQVQQTTNTVSHRITLRFVDGLTPRHRIVFRARVFNIHAVIDPDERRIQQVLDCTEVIGQAV
jgi:SPP1 family predicted phage head-tail adaptor